MYELFSNIRTFVNNTTSNVLIPETVNNSRWVVDFQFILKCPAQINSFVNIAQI